MVYYKKTFLVILAIVVQIFCTVTNVSAIDYDVNKLGSFLFVPTESYVLKDDGGLLYFSAGDNANYPGINLSTVRKIMELHVKFDRTIPANSMLNFYYRANASECISATGTSACQNFKTTPYVIKAYEGKAYLYESTSLTDINSNYQNYTRDPNSSAVTPSTNSGGTSYSEVVNIKMIVTQDVDELVFAFSKAPTGYMQLIPGSYIGLANVGGDLSSISDSLDKQNEQHEKELTEQQDSVDNSKTAADDSQSDVDSGSASFLKVITDVIGVLISAKATNCVIHMTYGDYFDAPVDFCSLDPPPVITGLTSIILVFMMFKLSQSVINQIVQIIGSFQR